MNKFNFSKHFLDIKKIKNHNFLRSAPELVTLENDSSLVSYSINYENLYIIIIFIDHFACKVFLTALKFVQFKETNILFPASRNKIFWVHILTNFPELLQAEWEETGHAIEVGIKKGIVNPFIHKRYPLPEVRSSWKNFYLP